MSKSRARSLYCGRTYQHLTGPAFAPLRDGETPRNRLTVTSGDSV